MTVTETLGRKVLAGGQLTKKEAMTLYGQPLEELCTMADTVRARFHAQAFSLCTIVNGKSGRCTENCRFCAQSAHYHTEAAVYPLCDQEEILAQLEAVRGGQFSDRELEAARRAVSSSLRSALDSQGRLEDHWTTQALSGRALEGPDALIDPVERVTADDVVRAAQAVELDTVYRLMGKEED